MTSLRLGSSLNEKGDVSGFWRPEPIALSCAAAGDARSGEIRIDAMDRKKNRTASSRKPSRCHQPGLDSPRTQSGLGNWWTNQTGARGTGAAGDPVAPERGPGAGAIRSRGGRRSEELRES